MDGAPTSCIPPALARDVELYDLQSCEATGLELTRQLAHDVEPTGRGCFRERICKRRLDTVGGKGARGV